MIALGKIEEPEELLATTNTDRNEVIPMEEVATSDEKIGSLPGTPVARKTKLEMSYPSGEFKINDTKVVFATGGTSFLAIARQYDISLARVFEFNELPASESLVNDQLIYLQRKRKTGANEFHIVKEGESLYDISQVEGIRLESLLSLNQLGKEMLPAEGQRLYLKSKAAERPLLASEQSEGAREMLAINEPRSTEAGRNGVQHASLKTIFHTVRPKETIYSISRKHNVRIDDLLEWNQLTSHTLKTGQQLKIYK
jgi:LysM repeat protein